MAAVNWAGAQRTKVAIAILTLRSESNQLPPHAICTALTAPPSSHRQPMPSWIAHSTALFPFAFACQSARTGGSSDAVRTGASADRTSSTLKMDAGTDLAALASLACRNGGQADFTGIPRNFFASNTTTATSTGGRRRPRQRNSRRSAEPDSAARRPLRYR